MIIGPGFIWLHFPKCAGSFTEKLLRRVAPRDGSVVFDPIDPKQVTWHHTIRQRERKTGTSLAGKEIVCNFRRLPYWIISRIQYEQKRTGKAVPREMYIKGSFFEQDGRECHADLYVERYSEPQVDHWIRTEFIREDFSNVFSRYFDLDQEIINDFMKEKINVSGWDGDLSKWFGPGDLERLYESCPKWKVLEMELYGDLVTDRF